MLDWSQEFKPDVHDHEVNSEDMLSGHCPVASEETYIFFL